MSGHRANITQGLVIWDNQEMEVGAVMYCNELKKSFQGNRWGCKISCEGSIYNFPIEKSKEVSKGPESHRLTL